MSIPSGVLILQRSMMSEYPHEQSNGLSHSARLFNAPSSTTQGQLGRSTVNGEADLEQCLMQLTKESHDDTTSVSRRFPEIDAKNSSKIVFMIDVIRPMPNATRLSTIVRCSDQAFVCRPLSVRSRLRKASLTILATVPML
jgi:hypothetical protein